MAKPAFDPSQPFEVVANQDPVPAGNKPAFDPSKPFEEVSAEVDPALLAANPMSAEFSPTESLIRTARSAVKGATLGASQLPVGGVTALSQTVADLIDAGKLESAEKLVAHLKRNYEADWKRQTAFENEHSTTAMVAEGLGGAIPISPAMKVAQAGMEGVQTFGQLLKQSAKTGAAAAVAMKAGDQAARAPFEGQKPTDQLIEAAEAGTVGAVAAPVITTGLGAVGAGYEAAKSRVKPMLVKLATSDVGLRVVQILTGRNMDMQKRFIALEKEIEQLPTPESVVSFFDQVKEQIRADQTRWINEYPEVEKRLNLLDEVLEKKRLNAEGVMKEKLSEAKLQLRGIQDDLKNRILSQAPEATDATRAAKDAMKDPSLGGYVEIGNLARKTIQEKLVAESAKATELIDPEYRLNRDVILDIIKKVRKSRFKNALFDSEESGERALRDLADNIERKYKKQLTGLEIKDLIKRFDRTTEYANPGEFNEALDAAFQDIRKGLDAELKGYNEDYKVAMRDIVEPIAKAYELTSKHLSTPEKIQGLFRKAADNPFYQDILKQIKQASGVDVEEPYQLLQAAREMRLKGQRKVIESLPEVQALNESQRLIDMTKDSNFERAVYQTVSDKETAQKIINLRKEILVLADERFAEQEVEKQIAFYANQRPGIQKQVEAAKAQRDAAISRALKLSGYEKGEQAVQKLLRAPQNEAESVSATKLIDAIASLPEAEFGEMFSLLNMSDPAKFDGLVKAMRVKAGMDRAITQGSKRVNMFSVLGAAIGAFSGLAKVPAVGAALGAFGGSYLDEFGGRVTQAYLRKMVRMQGLPTYNKMIELSPVPYTTTLKNMMASRISEMALEIKDSEKLPVDPANYAAIGADIKKSSLNSVERAKAERDLYRMGYIEGKTAKSLMLEGIPKKEGKGAVGAKLVPQLTEPKKAPDLKADKPDILERIKRKAYSGQR